MILIFDLDYTLLDTKKFKQGLAKALNLSITNFEKSYSENFKNTPPLTKGGARKINYNLKKHLKILSSSLSSQTKQSKIDSFLKNIQILTF